MNEKRFKVVDERGNVLAANMSLETALLLMKSIIIEKYFGEVAPLTIIEEVGEEL